MPFYVRNLMYGMLIKTSFESHVDVVGALDS